MFLQIQQSQQTSQLNNQFQQRKNGSNKIENKLLNSVNQQIQQIQKPFVGNFNSNYNGFNDELADYTSQYSDQSNKQERIKLPSQPNFSNTKQFNTKILHEIQSPLSDREKLNCELLFKAVSQIQYDVVENLLKRERMSPLLKDFDKNTPLHICMQNFSKDIYLSGKIAKLLLDYGANPNCRNKEGWCPIHLAAKKGSLSAIKFAVAHNLSKLQSNLDGQKNKKSDQTSLIATGQKGLSKEEDDSLSISQIKPKQQNLQLFNLKKKGGPQKWSLLHIAANLGHASMLEFLYQINYDMTTQNIMGQQARQVAIQSLILHKLLKKYENLWVNMAIFSDDEMAQGTGYLNYGGVIDQVSNAPFSAFQEYQQQQIYAKQKDSNNEKRNVQNLKNLIEQTMKKKKSFLNSSNFSSIDDVYENQDISYGNQQRKLSNFNNDHSLANNQYKSNNYDESYLKYSSGGNNLNQGGSNQNLLNKGNFQNKSNNYSFLTNNSNLQATQKKIEGQINYNGYGNMNNVSYNQQHKKLLDNSQFHLKNENEDDFALDIQPENTEEDLEATNGIYQREGTFKLNSSNRIDGSQKIAENKFLQIQHKETELTEHEFEECTYEEKKAKDNKFDEQFSQNANSSSNQMVGHQRKKADWNIFNQRKQKEMQIAQQLTLDKFLIEIQNIQNLIIAFSATFKQNSINQQNLSSTAMDNMNIPFVLQKQLPNTTMAKSPSYNQLFCSNQSSNYQTRQVRSNSKVIDSQWLTPLPSHRQNNSNISNLRQNEPCDLSSVESNDQQNYLNNNYSKLPETLKLINYLQLIHLKLIYMDQIHFQSEVLPMNIYILSEFLSFDKSSSSSKDALKKQSLIIPNILQELFEQFIQVLRNSCYYQGEINLDSIQVSPRSRMQSFSEVQSQQAAQSAFRSNYHLTSQKQPQNFKNSQNITPQSSPFQRTANSPHLSKSPFQNRTKATPNSTCIKTNIVYSKYFNQNSVSRNASKSPSCISLNSSVNSDSQCSDNEDSVDTKPMTSLEIFDCLIRLLRLFEVFNFKEAKQKILSSFSIKIKSPYQYFKSEEPLIVKERQRSFSPFSIVQNQDDGTPNGKRRDMNKRQGAYNSYSPFGRSNNNYTLKEQYVKCHKEDHYSEKILYDFESLQTFEYLQANFAFNQIQQPYHLLVNQKQSVSPQPRQTNINQNNNIKFVEMQRGYHQSKTTISSPINKLENNVSPVSYKNDVSLNYFPATKTLNLSQMQIANDQSSQKSTNLTSENNKSILNHQRALSQNIRHVNINNYNTDNTYNKAATNNKRNVSQISNNNIQSSQIEKSNLNIFKNDSSTISLISNQSNIEQTSFPQQKQNENQASKKLNGILNNNNNNNFTKQQQILKNNNPNESLEISIDQINQKEQKLNDLQRINGMQIPNIRMLNTSQNEKRNPQTFQSLLNEQRGGYKTEENLNARQITPNASFINTNNNKDLSFSQISMSPLLNKSNLIRNGSSNSFINQTNQSFINQPNIFNSTNISAIEKQQNFSYTQQTNSFISMQQNKPMLNQNQQYFQTKKDNNNYNTKQLQDSNKNFNQPTLNIIDTNKMASQWLNSKQQQLNNTMSNNNQNNKLENFSNQNINRQNVAAIYQIDLRQFNKEKQFQGPQMVQESNKQLQGDIGEDDLESKRNLLSTFQASKNAQKQVQTQQQYYSNPQQSFQRQLPNTFNKQIQQYTQNLNQNNQSKPNQQKQILSKNVQMRNNTLLGEENVTDDEEYNDEVNQNKLQNSESNKYRAAKELISPFTIKQNLEKYQIQ
ncbi:ankyrin repeat protein (macronuclear) [Tetrahymena thermophila SB210]|uniref:Ankyrin repeat protein n=1 Tax=Tetrahymena thermophila (strain SB210) TaxID=312017 RepID=Q234Q8_TETTS|nr:ankyrin repeat protein [Tetrahymena thermophila SB210]EAR91945.2 ankyrin repeat protein [Tetrahymena thermophila SB210]|eukprot:XP_001012190.2 ankyrin repeat protein [Tetrahymena thermophila SB210]